MVSELLQQLIHVDPVVALVATVWFSEKGYHFVKSRNGNHGKRMSKEVLTAAIKEGTKGSHKETIMVLNNIADSQRIISDTLVRAVGFMEGRLK